MTKSPFISIETEDGIVVLVEGQITTGSGIFGSGAVEFTGKKINDVLNICALEGYEHFDTDVIGKRKVHRLKLRTN